MLLVWCIGLVANGADWGLKSCKNSARLDRPAVGGSCYYVLQCHILFGILNLSVRAHLKSLYQTKRVPVEVNFCLQKCVFHNFFLSLKGLKLRQIFLQTVQVQEGKKFHGPARNQVDTTSVSQHFWFTLLTLINVICVHKNKNIDPAIINILVACFFLYIGIWRCAFFMGAFFRIFCIDLFVFFATEVQIWVSFCNRVLYFGMDFYCFFVCFFLSLDNLQIHKGLTLCTISQKTSLVCQ